MDIRLNLEKSQDSAAADDKDSSKNPTTALPPAVSDEQRRTDNKVKSKAGKGAFQNLIQQSKAESAATGTSTGVAHRQGEIKEIAPRDVDDLVNTLFANLGKLSAIDPLPERSEKNICTTDWANPPRTSEEMWNARLSTTRYATGLIMRTTRPDSVKAFYDNETPLGGLTMTKALGKAPPQIPAFATHPKSKGVGSALLEAAVAQSVAWGNEGRLELGAIDEDSKRAYLAMGFTVHSQPFAMRLDPKESDKWIQTDGQWRLKSKRPFSYDA